MTPRPGGHAARSRLRRRTVPQHHRLTGQHGSCPTRTNRAEVSRAARQKAWLWLVGVGVGRGGATRTQPGTAADYGIVSAGLA